MIVKFVISQNLVGFEINNIATRRRVKVNEPPKGLVFDVGGYGRNKNIVLFLGLSPGYCRTEAEPLKFFDNR